LRRRAWDSAKPGQPWQRAKARAWMWRAQHGGWQQGLSQGREPENPAHRPDPGEGRRREQGWKIAVKDLAQKTPFGSKDAGANHNLMSQLFPADLRMRLDFNSGAKLPHLPLFANFGKGERAGQALRSIGRTVLDDDRRKRRDLLHRAKSADFALLSHLKAGGSALSEQQGRPVFPAQWAFFPAQLHS
jgi:hemolysin-activating ACP:hemolysin acyltransferase